MLIGAWISAALAGRLRIAVERPATLARHTRLGFAFGGGVAMAAGAVLARGCTSGQALTGGALLSVGSWSFMMSAFAAGYAVANHRGGSPTVTPPLLLALKGTKAVPNARATLDFREPGRPLGEARLARIAASICDAFASAAAAACSFSQPPHASSQPHPLRASPPPYCARTLRTAPTAGSDSAQIRRFRPRPTSPT